MSYRVEIVRRAQKQLARIQAQDRERIMDAVDILIDDPRPHNSTKLQGYSNTRRLRVGDYRIIYELDETSSKMTVTRIAHRREAYR